MSEYLSYSDCLPDVDLLCSEDSADALSAGESPELSSEFDSPAIFVEEEESIAGFIEDERTFFLATGGRHSQSLSSSILESSSRSQSVAWILKMRTLYGFQAVTAYLAVNYLDRFLISHPLPETIGWPLQLLSVACLSLAAKMEEPLVPSLLDLQIEGPKYVFDPKTILRMELLVLDVLDWRLRFVTPFAFINFFAYKIDSTGTWAGLLVSRSTDIILSNIQEASLMEYLSSSIAAATILCAASEIPSLAFFTPEHAESWCDGLSKDKVSNCYKIMQKVVVDHRRRKSIKVIPQFRVTSQITRTRSSCDSSSCSSSTSLTSPYDRNNKRRKSNNQYSWGDDDDNCGSSG
ncbi:hypothetical protein Cgig2_007015 [Carnegiea gigantea]|uniref:Cyclin N-terminal domain-containing protein n=1 Tax=Carnegiea gigantea TaxID=171969 RepID=A0A9Q1QEK9_9CARY|nr:hypothetical protein Cgig2_007015 [Carnegiea gigantea]